MGEFFPKPKFFGEKVEVEFHLSSYATKAYLKYAIGVDTSDFAKKLIQLN